MTNTNDRADVAAERALFEREAANRGLDFTKSADAWNRPQYAFSHLEARFQGWLIGRAAISSAVPDGGKDSELRGIERAYQAAKDAGKEPGWANHYANALQAIRALIQGMK